MDTTDLRSKDEVTQDIEQTRRQMQESLRRSKDYVTRGNPVSRAVHKTAGACKTARDKVVRAAQAVSDTARKSNATIHRTPYRFVGIALLIGTAVGWLLRRPREK
jgi:ElaB/YqjD/DUF883 family membrane-anchored ribosome-binding protein